MKVKALILGLLIAGATVLSYTAIDSENGNIQAIDKRKIKIPGQN
mgnify:CR=1 FL=1|tara:strand:+ start:1866 stop:2000 length:135 start_codon:yes stop_codon:yes gene_type:complete